MYYLDACKDIEFVKILLKYFFDNSIQLRIFVRGYRFFPLVCLEIKIQNMVIMSYFYVQQYG